MVPREAPLPTPANLPFQSWRRGNHNSKSISDLAFSVILPVTRQNGVSTLILPWVPRRAAMLNGGCTNSADLIDHRGLPAPGRVAEFCLSGGGGFFFRVCARDRPAKEKKKPQSQEILFTGRFSLP